uniref:Uncharacterized protein n=1 Tax=Erpetoichthys calabaricus TaxID=27687 RepID=A0A8C4RR68_ERPCA
MNILVKSTTNRFYHCKYGMTELYELLKWADSTPPLIVYVRSDNYISFIEPLRGIIETKIYPLKNEIKNSFSSGILLCPYVYFHYSSDAFVFYLDKSEMVSFWAEISYVRSAGLEIKIFNNKKDMLHMETSTSFRTQNQYYIKNVVSDSCCQCTMRKTVEGYVVFISCIGCNHFSLFFMCRYDGDTFVKHVDANFVVWEKNGRRDFFYNATMKEVNYRSCFELTPGSFGNLTKPYEILNSSGYNYLTWPKDHNAIYVFIIKILDPNYSTVKTQTQYTHFFFLSSLSLSPFSFHLHSYWQALSSTSRLWLPY